MINPFAAALNWVKSLFTGKPQKGRRQIDANDWRRLKKGEPGYSPTSAQYVKKSTKTITDKSPRLSARQFQQAKAGKSLEARAKEGGRNLSPAKREATEKAKATKRMRALIPNLTDKQVGLINAYNFDGLRWDDMTDEQQEQFKDLFDKYPPDVVRDWLNSPAR